MSILHRLGRALRINQDVDFRTGERLSRSFSNHREEYGPEDRDDYLRPHAPGSAGLPIEAIHGGGGFRNARAPERSFVLELHGRTHGHVVGEYMGGINADATASIIADLTYSEAASWRSRLSRKPLAIGEGFVVWKDDDRPIHLVARRVA